MVLAARGYFKGVTVQKVCRLARDEGGVRRTLDCVQSDSENASKILRDLQEGNVDLYRFEKMLEAHQNYKDICPMLVRNPAHALEI